MSDGVADLKADLLPLVGATDTVGDRHQADHWRTVFGALWGAENLRAVRGNRITGSLHSRKVGELTFNRIVFGNQQFERARARRGRDPEPFYSLSFPESGHAEIEIGEAGTRLMPRNVYLLNNGLAARLKVAEEYSTFNIKIPLSALEHRLGRKTDILARAIVQPDAIYHMMQRLIVELLRHVDDLDERSVQFMTSQMLDTVAFFLVSGGTSSDDSLAVQSVRARVIAYLDAHFRDAALTPERIAAACGISRSYLYKVFSNGETVMERLRNRRLEAARGMIETNPANQPLTRIAYACGFTSSSEFSRQFKAAFGVAPSRL
ncbi:helix-turn-helix transcriptional regulator [Polymorphum gilvum]|uniref:AraC-family transcriptional regulator n=1 Tax=Polymorphum gilvum (strain LMG 25793 / CGMCC 1.9160 / SL003B-26A1) TaxID=991905 RepID=F2J3Y3_POLGS|nr:AraC family transcriptional regulator [Polymorphum gilvum]ADZ68965.1 AraC-family transcriptional regulator [Polymorphum gilvum SL003B-26A1]